MNTATKIILTGLLTFLLNNSCNKNDDSPEDTFIVENLTIQMNENPNNDDIIGAVQYEVSSGFQVRFSLAAQSNPDAIRVSLQGDLYVNDASIFDFETHPTLVAELTAEKIRFGINFQEGVFTEEILATKTVTVIINLIDLPE